MDPDGMLTRSFALLSLLCARAIILDFLLLAVLPILGVWAYNVFIYPFHTSPLRHLPGPTDDAFFLGQTPKFLRVSWLPDLFCEWSLEWPATPFIRYLNFANSETLIVNSITAYKEVLQTRNACFEKPAFARRFAYEFISDGLPFAEGKIHQMRRAILSKPFSTWRIKSLVPTVQLKARQLVNTLKEERTGLKRVQVETHIGRAVMDIIGIETLGVDLNHLRSDDSPLYDLISRPLNISTFAHIVNFFNSIVSVRKFLPVKECREFDQCTQDARDFLKGYVASRRAAIAQGKARSGDTPDALQYMLENENSLWEADGIVEYALNLFVLGHDTTACSIVWAIHELSRRPNAQMRLRQEIEQLREHCPEPSFDQIEKLTFLHNFVREVLRMYCPVALSPRQAIKDVQIAETFIPKGTIIQLSPAVMNLHPSVWGEDAAVFNPDRWNHLTGDAASAYAFETFHNGPRMCIGKQLSMMEMKVILLELVSRFRIESVLGNEKVEIATPTFTLKMKNKLVVRLEEL